MKIKLLCFATAMLLLSACGDETGEFTNNEGVDTLNVPDDPIGNYDEPDDPVADTTLQISTVEFPSKDSLMITADIYEKGDQPWLLLCHQARWSRGEYKETGPMFVEWGYNCMAIDQRSGDAVNDVKNETAARASEQGLSGDYIDALPDIEAAVDYLSTKAGGEQIIILGSSYSSALVLKVANESDKVRAVASFSPGEYYDGHTVADWPFKMEKPLFVTSATNEVGQTEEVLTMIMQKYVTYFLPEGGQGEHGSRALWESKSEHQEYRMALKDWFAMVESGGPE